MSRPRPQTTRLTIRLFTSRSTAGECFTLTIGSKTSVLQLKKKIEKKYSRTHKIVPASEQILRLRVNGSKALENDVVLWEMGKRAAEGPGILSPGAMPVHIGCFVGWDGGFKG